jgi:hypothetical protein
MGAVLIGVQAGEGADALELRVGRLRVDDDHLAAHGGEVRRGILVGPRLVREQADVGERAQHPDLVVEPDGRPEHQGIGEEGGDDERLQRSLRARRAVGRWKWLGAHETGRSRTTRAGTPAAKV